MIAAVLGLLLSITRPAAHASNASPRPIHPRWCDPARCAFYLERDGTSHRFHSRVLVDDPSTIQIEILRADATDSAGNVARARSRMYVDGVDDGLTFGQAARLTASSVRTLLRAGAR